MNALPLTTVRRLKKIPQTSSVWEGDRRALLGMESNLEQDSGEKNECIMWVDGSEGVVRAMEIVSPEMGLEAVVRTLLRAIENPHNPARPSRPQKIIVRDRELQFFLRGALQNLEINIDYVPDLPLIDEFFRGFETIAKDAQPTISSQLESLLIQTAEGIWHEAPWDLLADHDIIAIELNCWGVGTIYAYVMGMLGREYGIVLYRSLDSMKQFRSAVLTQKSVDRIEKAFLDQDCWFLNYEPDDEDFDLEDEYEEDEDEDDYDLADLPLSEIRPVFGSVHPLEGMRLIGDEEEALAVYVSLKALQLFFQASQKQLAKETIKAISKRYKINLPVEAESEKNINVTVSTMPELALELLEMSEAAELEEQDSDEELSIPIRLDLMPEESYLSLDVLPWELVETLTTNPQIGVEIPEKYIDISTAKGEGMPVIVIQTSRPKAKVLIEKLQADGGLTGICFNPATDHSGFTYDLGILQTANQNLYLVGEFINYDSDYLKARQKWNIACQKTKGICSLIVAMGITGTSRGNPQLRDMMALFATKVLEASDLGMGVLQLNSGLEP